MSVASSWPTFSLNLGLLSAQDYGLDFGSLVHVSQVKRGAINSGLQRLCRGIQMNIFLDQKIREFPPILRTQGQLPGPTWWKVRTKPYKFLWPPHMHTLHRHTHTHTWINESKHYFKIIIGLYFGAFIMNSHIHIFHFWSFIQFLFLSYLLNLFFSSYCSHLCWFRR